MIEESFANLPTSHVRTLVFFLSPGGDKGSSCMVHVIDSKLALPGGFLKSKVAPKNERLKKY